MAQCVRLGGGVVHPLIGRYIEMELRVERLRDLKGLGPKSESMLTAVGVDSVEVLKELGAIRAFIKVKQHGEINPSLNLLYALVGALEGEHWLSIAQHQKADLIMQLEGYDELEKLFESSGESFHLQK